KKVVVFLVLTLALSAIFYAFIIASGSIQGYSSGLMWCPGVAALLTQLTFQRNIRGLGWSMKPSRYWLVGYGVPLGYGLLVYGIVWMTGLGTFAPAAMAQQTAAQLNLRIQSPDVFLAIYVVIAATAGIVSSCATALGEEIGWRGLLVPELAKRCSFTATALISGAVWAIWHYPAILFANYNNADAPTGFGLVCFTVMIIGISFAFAWLRLQSGSLWPTVLFHASHNLFIQAIFTPLTGTTRFTPYVIGEFGLGLALVTLPVAYLFWRKRGELPISLGMH
ncbi:MAG: type II CAAX endopeptidase family protein, partial [Roseiflexaceae bacterium]